MRCFAWSAWHDPAFHLHLPIIDLAKALAQASVLGAGSCCTAAGVDCHRHDLFGTVGAMTLLMAAAAGQGKAADLDGELLALCTEYIEWTRADRAIDVALDIDRASMRCTASRQIGESTVGVLPWASYHSDKLRPLVS